MTIPAEQAIEKVDLAVDDVAQRCHNRAIGSRHGSVQGLRVEPSAERQKLCGRPGIMPDGIVKCMSHLDLLLAA